MTRYLVLILPNKLLYFNKVVATPQSILAPLELWQTLPLTFKVLAIKEEVLPFPDEPVTTIFILGYLKCLNKF